MNAALGETIVAVSSPPGRALRGLVRLSGDRTQKILSGLLGNQPHPSSRRLTACRLHLAPSQSPLPGLVSIFAAPRSFTGQDMAEVQIPGNPALLDRLLHRCIDFGGRLAEPGEFTFRAYLAGKLDLTQAEGVAATISAVSDGQLQAATLLREGRLGTMAAQWVDQLANGLALTEAAIDFVDQDDVVPISPEDLHQRLKLLESGLDDLLKHSRGWGAIESLPRVVLVGPPSAGKSTLFNVLLGRERAVSSPMPGTTRDVLSEPLTLKVGLPGQTGLQVEVLLVDIAGLDAAADGLDAQVQAGARRAIAAADLILAIDDGQIANASFMAKAGQPVLSIQTKSDLAPIDRGGYDVAVSARTGQGLEDLRNAIARQVGDRGVSLVGQMLALQPRHEAALLAAAVHLRQAIELLDPQRSARAIGQVELIAGALRVALNELACLGGTVTPDDVIGRVFAAFCIGK